MYNLFYHSLKKVICFSFLILSIISCKKDIPITFSEEIITSENNAIVEIVYPKASGDTSKSKAINSVIEAHISKAINFNEDDTIILLEESISKFKINYNEFKSEFPESNQKWEALVDGEVVYKSPDIISIAINTYIDTGGAHGNGNVSFLNFNPETGMLYTMDDMITKPKEFSNLVKKFFEKQITQDDSKSLENYFYENDFSLPATIGFNDEGIIIFYNTYEIAAYSEGITEFTIPFNEAIEFIKVN